MLLVGFGRLRVGPQCWPRGATPLEPPALAGGHF